MSKFFALIFGCVLACGLAGGASAADRFFSYDPANAATRRIAGDLTFEFRPRMLVFQRVVAVRSTEGEATAYLEPAADAALGPGGLDRLIGRGAPDHDLYEVLPKAQGAELIRAFCPGSRRAWMAFGRLAIGQPLRVQVLGDGPGGGPARLCRTFDFNFHGAWQGPPGRSVRPGDLLVPKPPY